MTGATEYIQGFPYRSWGASMTSQHQFLFDTRYIRWSKQLYTQYGSQMLHRSGNGERHRSGWEHSLCLCQSINDIWRKIVSHGLHTSTVTQRKLYRRTTFKWSFVLIHTFLLQRRIYRENRKCPAHLNRREFCIVSWNHKNIVRGFKNMGRNHHTRIRHKSKAYFTHP